MAGMDWSYLTDGLDIASVDRGVTTGVPRPPGGGNFLFAFNSLVAAAGSVALFANLDDFAPMARGGSIRGCLQRGPGGGPTGFSPFLFLCGQGNVRQRPGLPARALRRRPAPRRAPQGLHQRRASPTPTALGVAAQASGESFSPGDLAPPAPRRDRQRHGRRHPQGLRRTTSTPAPSATPPDWHHVGGMAEFIDDHLGINSGSQPLTSGRGGFGFAVQGRDAPGLLRPPRADAAGLMELDAFRSRLGLGQGRIKPQGAIAPFGRLHVRPRRRPTGPLLRAGAGR
jgi:hypothetical protein